MLLPRRTSAPCTSSTSPRAAMPPLPVFLAPSPHPARPWDPSAVAKTPGQPAPGGLQTGEGRVLSCCPRGGRGCVSELTPHLQCHSSGGDGCPGVVSLPRRGRPGPTAHCLGGWLAEQWWPLHLVLPLSQRGLSGPVSRAGIVGCCPWSHPVEPFYPGAWLARRVGCPGLATNKAGTAPQHSGWGGRPQACVT